LKFAHLAERAAGLGATVVATGHYARVEFDEDTRRYRLFRAIDRDKDQSYFLFPLTQNQLAAAVFPVGHLTKAEVRDHAERVGLRVARKPDSHEICFVADGDVPAFVEKELAESPHDGAIVDSEGRTLGRHRGLHRYTVGQRRGLGLSAARPLYVLRLEPALHRLVVGPREELTRPTLTATRVNWIAGHPPETPIRATARIRHRHADAAATITPDGDELAHVVFDVPQLAVTPGQAVVFYAGDEVLGGGWIQ
jgi:tRNA-specific 2-thiouridylase